MSEVRVRFAPSPTGFFHAGGARTLLFNWLYARHHGGKFVLRIEDTDQTRYEEPAVRDMLESMRWLGLDWDEGPEVGGPYSPYFQSQRLPLYQECAQKLLDSGAAYKCYCSEERLDQMRAEQQRRGQAPGYDGHCRQLTAQQQAEYEAQGRSAPSAVPPRRAPGPNGGGRPERGRPARTGAPGPNGGARPERRCVPVIRLKVPLSGETEFEDVLRGRIRVQNAELHDLVLIKSDGFPTYHMANVVDDHVMQISHVLRAEEWLSSTPYHVLLYHASGWTPPQIAHLPVILNPEGKGKMSKRKTIVEGRPERDGSEHYVRMHEFRAAGYLPEAMFNFLALVGWSYDDKTDILTREQIISRFDLDHISKSPAKFSYDKLDWMNGVYIRQLSVDDLATRLQPFLDEAGLHADADTVRRITPLIQERMVTLSDAADLVDFFFGAELRYDPQLLVQKGMTAEQARQALAESHRLLSGAPSFDEATLEPLLRAKADALGLKARQFFGTLRVAATGREVSPPLFGTLAVLGREKVLDRLARAQELLAAAGA